MSLDQLGDWCERLSNALASSRVKGIGILGKNMTFSIQSMASDAKQAAVSLAALDSQTKDNVLQKVADLLRSEQDAIIEENKKDMDYGRGNDLSSAMLDRLLLNPERIEGIAQAVEFIITLDDPVGGIAKSYSRPNGLNISKQRIPLGVIAMVYESRPNVTIDAAALCFKAGNAVVLRGGKEAIHTNKALAAIFHQALEAFGVAKEAVNLVPVTDRAVMAELLTLSKTIDLIIPRGGEGLINYVSENSRIPVIQHFKGVCHLYVDEAADLTKALNIVGNGKIQRPSACNALETLLVNKTVAADYLPKVAELFAENKVRVHACENSIGYFEGALAATEEDYDTEYLELAITVRIVDDYETAVQHIHKYTSDHTEVIVTEDQAKANDFIRQINSAVVMVNASSRFSDGGELGLGAEIGISTTKLHAYGPMGLESLTTEKFVVIGEGQVRS